MTGNITKNFTVKELASRGELHFTPAMLEFVQMTQELRDWAASVYPSHAKSGLIISNCYRSAKHNKDVGGSSNSAHLDGRAMDITNVKPDTYQTFTTAWQAICSAHGKIGGINYYKWGVHITDYEDKFGNKAFTIRDLR